jgi:hypothetical protein
MLNVIRKIITGSIFLFFLTPLIAQEANYDESKVPAYTLPDPLILTNGETVTKTKTWTSQRRKEILELFREHVYGRSPGKPKGMRFEVTSVDRSALNGTATRKEVTVFFNGERRTVRKCNF